MSDSQAASRRVLVEVAIIVGSILLAFWIDAGWDSLQTGRVEDQLFDAVSQEMLWNREGAEETVLRAQTRIDRLDRFLAARPGELVALPADTVRGLFIALSQKADFEPRLSASEVLLRAPDLGSRRSRDVRGAVANWRLMVADAEEERASLQQVSDDLTRRIALRLTLAEDLAAGDLVDLASAAGVSVLRELRADAEFTSRVMLKREILRTYLFELNGVVREIDSVEALLPS